MYTVYVLNLLPPSVEMRINRCQADEARRETLEKVAAAGVVSFDDPKPDKEDPEQNAFQDVGY